MPQDAITEVTLQNMAVGGFQNIPTDSGSGWVNRPVAVGQEGGRVAALDTMFAYWIDTVGDPSEVFLANPDYFEKMMMHPDVQGAMRKRERNVASFPDSIIPNPMAKDRTVAKQIADYVGGVWAKIPNRHMLFECMQQAVLMGGMGIEWIWHRDNTRAKPIEYPTNWFPLHKSRFVFDRLGNMALRTRETPVWGSYIKANEVSAYLWKGGRNPPLGKFCYHKYRIEPGTWENPNLEGYIYHGKGECVPLFYVITFDWFVLNNRMEWLATFARPARFLWYPENDPVTQQTEAVVSAMQNQSVITMPRPPFSDKDAWFAIEQMDVPHASYDAMSLFQKEWTVPKINIILLGSAEEQEQQEGKGGYSSHVSRHETGPKMYYAYDAMCIESTINDQLIPAIVWNGPFPNVPIEYMPKLYLDTDQGKNRKEAGEIIQIGRGLQLPIGKRWAQQQLGIPQPDDGEELLPAEPQPGVPAGPGGPQPPPPGDPQPKTEVGANGAPEAAVNDQERGMPRHTGNGNGRAEA